MATSKDDFFGNKVLDAEIEEEPEQEIIEPFDPTKIKIDTRQITIDLVLNRIKFGKIDVFVIDALYKILSVLKKKCGLRCSFNSFNSTLSCSSFKRIFSKYVFL